MKFGWTWLLAVSAALAAERVDARETTYKIDIDTGSLTAALSALAAQTGISVGVDGRLPTTTVVRLHGIMTVRSALDRVLRRSRWRAIRIAPTVYRLAPRGAMRDEPTSAPGPDILVTARKQSEPLSTIAGPIAVFVPADSHRQGGTTDMHDVAAAVGGMAITNLGPGRDRPFLRGVSDSPFNGFSQSTVSVQLDDGRITYDAAEPGLRLVDVDRVEVLKGPQGPLYGTGALGGVYRIVTNRPVLDAIAGTAGFEFTSIASGGGGIGGKAEATFNLPLILDRAAVRLTGYTGAAPGWISDGAGRDGLNQSLVSGGRAALRVAPTEGWTVDMSATAQTTHVRDSQYVDRNAEDLVRSLVVREPRDGHVLVVQGSITGPVGGMVLTVATSHAWQDQDDRYDASASAAALGVIAPATYRDRRSYRVFDQEVRLGSAPGSRFVWTAGGAYLAATTRASGDLSGGAAQPFFMLNRNVVEAAGFADGSMPLAGRLKAEAGVRIFRTTTDDERDTPFDRTTTNHALTGVTPSGSLSYDIAPGSLVYVRFGTAFRPGGVDPTNQVTGRYEADEVSTFDVGGRARMVGWHLGIEANLFRSSWRDVQSDYLQPDGLVATRNAGNAAIVGGELSLDWSPPGGWRMRGVASWQHGRLTGGPGGRELPVDLRLPVAPDIAARVEIDRCFTWQDWRIAPYVKANMVGAARLSFDPGLDRHTPGYVVMRTGVELRKADLRLRIGLENLLDARADTFAFGNPFSIRSEQQYTPLRPRAVMVGFSRDF